MIIKSAFTKEELIKTVQKTQVFPNIMDGRPIVMELLLYIQTVLYENVINEIRQRQSRISNLYQDENKFLAVWNGDLTPGCKDCCLKQKWTQIRNSVKCTQNCKFCYYRGLPQEYMAKNRYGVAGMSLTKDEVKCLIDRQGHLLNGLAWLHMEPLMELDKIPELMRYIASKNLWQWLYTNGVSAHEETLRKLSDWGLNEIRFNLQATNFSDAVIENVKIATNYFDYVCIETPMYSKSFKNFVGKKQRILDTGLTHIHTPELQLGMNTYKDFANEGAIYRHRTGYVSPISSRSYTYDLIEMAEEEKWEVTIHDCSNEVKFYRGCGPSGQFGHIDYETSMNLPQEAYLYALDKYFEDDVKYEIF